MEFRVLGPLRAIGAEGEMPIGPPKQRCLLAFLLIHANEVVSLERIVDALWDSPPKSAGSIVHVYVSGLRKALGRDVVATERPGYVLVTRDGDVDADRFERALAEARTLEGHAAVTSLEAALELWQGPAYGDVAYEEFAQPEIRRLTELRAQAEILLNDARLDVGEVGAVLGAVSAQLEERPLSEALWRQQMLALYRSGRQPDALRSYQRACGAFAEIGTEPSADLSDLEGRILLRDPSLLIGPQRTATATNLPNPVSTFIGRESVGQQVIESLRDHRLITLTGPGGIGKTRLAVEVGRQVLDGPWRGVWLIEFAAAIPGDRLESRVLAGIDAPDAGDDGSEREMLLEYLRTSATLVILDNCEHLLPEISEFVHGLLVAAPDLRILATSRSPLGVDGELVVRVPALGMLAEENEQSEAARLMVDRAHLADSTIGPDVLDPDLFEEALRFTAGMPLAIELAASRLGTEPLSHLVRSIREGADVLAAHGRIGYDRHAAMANTIAWSHRLLSPDAQSRFRRLSVFRGGFSLEVAESFLARLEATKDDGRITPNPVGELIAASLVTPGEDHRFTLPEPIRRYAAELLDDEGETEIARRAHAIEFRNRFRVADSFAFRRPLPPESDLRSHEADLDNLDAAVGWWLAHEPAIAAGLTTIAAGVLGIVGRPIEAMRWFERILTAPSEPSRALARCLSDACLPVLYAGGSIDGQRYLQRLIEVTEALDDESWRCVALSRQADFASVRGDEELAFQLTLEAAERLQPVNPQAVGPVLNNRTVGLLLAGRLDDAESIGWRYRTAAAEHGERMDVLLADAYLSLVAAYRGDGPLARQRLTAFDDDRPYGEEDDGRFVVDAVLARAEIALLEEDPAATAHHAWTLVDRIRGWGFSDTAFLLARAEAMTLLGLAALHEGDREAAVWYLVHPLADSRRLGHRRFIKVPLAALAAAIVVDRPIEGTEVISALRGEAARERYHLRATTASAIGHGELLAARRFGDLDLEAARRRGEQMNLDEAARTCREVATSLIYGTVTIP